MVDLIRFFLIGIMSKPPISVIEGVRGALQNTVVDPSVLHDALISNIVCDIRSSLNKLRTSVGDTPASYEQLDLECHSVIQLF